MRLCQAQCQENKRKVPESPLLTARRGGLTVYATPWSQKWGRRLEALPSSSNIAAPFLGQFLGPIFGTTKEQTGAGRSWRPGFRPFAGASHPSAMQAAMDTHTHIHIIYIYISLHIIVEVFIYCIQLSKYLRTLQGSSQHRTTKRWERFG